jgi:LytS/YehU family sensor histidine kinase
MWVLNRLEGKTMSLYFFFNLLTTFILGILISHGYREVIIKLKWLELKIVALIPRVIISSVVCGAIFFFAHTLISEILIARESLSLEPLVVLQTTVNLSVNFVGWSLLYFLFHFIQNYRKEEIKNLKWQALSNEVELNKLKSQLNPHFIFNSMNSIRALVDENPEKSKDSITQLSNILRSSLLMGRKKLIPLSEELQLVSDYLSLEKTRFEERLQIQFNIEEDTRDHLLPPMLLQTLVENGIKHGISKLPEGGVLRVSAHKELDTLFLRIENSGFYDVNKEKETGFGLLNSRQRLNLLYGSAAYLKISNEEGMVVAEAVIPNEIKKLKIKDEAY